MKFWLGALILLSPFCQAASFDCASDKLSATEKAICGDEYLSGADNVLNRQWSAAYGNSLSRGLLKAQQLDWLKQRKDCNADVNCIKQAYQRRISQLSSLTAFSPLSKYFSADKIDPPMAQGLVSEGGYQLRDNPWLIKPLTSEYALAFAAEKRKEDISGYYVVGHAVADDNLFIYLVVEMNEGNNQLIEVNDQGHARHIRMISSEYSAYADPDGQDTPGKMHFYLYNSATSTLRVAMDVVADGAVVDSEEETSVAGPLPRYERGTWQGFCSDVPCHSYSQSPSEKWRVASGNFMSTDERDGVYLFEANRPDSGVNVFSQKANDRIEKDFSYMRNFVWGEGETFYFDNEGGMACVWRTDITSKTTERIIPVESIKYPYYLKYRGREMVVATDTDEHGSLYIATSEVK
ncbi:hypothetical protein EDF81_2722 [Enterobacter sp. BIGb0383]|uniref:lysozyme inhibitor LprI family protein n=1 Tax=unclassified Enterobacter TaxID=2608935 RepID=UPI000F4A0B76|nr:MULTISPECIES: hypothetical protein [unclassified Enterobacter]ROP59902.1 hypothetical protein EDF81_2722 [Enterobacter sp. BIGb0383]ROS08629.1 hypothetical protein EC848_2114 [Enterobacter sp. BIGb0359]